MNLEFFQLTLVDGGLFMLIGVGSIALIVFRFACQSDIVCPKGTRITDLWGHYSDDAVTRAQIESLTKRLNSKPAGLPEWESPAAYTGAHR